MWGTYIEGKIIEAKKGINDQKQAEMRVNMTLNSIFREPEEEPDASTDPKLQSGNFF